MHESTTVRVSRSTRDNLHQLADADRVTLDEEITRLVRAERMRRMGRALSSTGPDAEERSWLDMSAATVGDHSGG